MSSVSLSIRRRIGMQSSSSDAPPPRIVARFSNGTIGTTPSGFADDERFDRSPSPGAAHGAVVEREHAGLERLGERRRSSGRSRRAGRARAPIRGRAESSG